MPGYVAGVPGRVVALRRYPVKSMGGESLDAVELGLRGIVGDRWFAVEDGNGHFASGKRTRRFRRHDDVFRYSATTLRNGSVEVNANGRRWRVGDPALDEELTAALGTSVRVTPEATVPHQDAGAISLVTTATLQWCAERLGVDADPRRLRVNVVLESDEAFIEEQWLGSTLTVGDAMLRCAATTERCRMIDIPQDGVRPRQRWLKPLAQQRDMRLGIYADVLRPGRISVGDPSDLEPRVASREAPGTGA